MSKFYFPPLHTGQVLVYANILCHYYPALLDPNIAGERRIARAASLARHNVRFHSDLPGCHDVESQTQTNVIYTVDPTAQTCTCPDSRAGYVCKHRIAVAIHTKGADLAWRLINETKHDPDEREAIQTGRYLPYPSDSHGNPVIPGEPMPEPVRIYLGNDPEIIAQQKEKGYPRQ